MILVLYNILQNRYGSIFRFLVPLCDVDMSQRTTWLIIWCRPMSIQLIVSFLLKSLPNFIFLLVYSYSSRSSVSWIIKTLETKPWFSVCVTINLFLTSKKTIRRWNAPYLYSVSYTVIAKNKLISPNLLVFVALLLFDGTIVNIIYERDLNNRS